MTQNNLLSALEHEHHMLICYQMFSQSQENAFLQEFLLRQQQQIESLNFMLNQRNIPLPQQFAPKHFYMGQNRVENLEVLLARENAKIDFYNQLLAQENDAEVRDLFYRFQATSYNQHLPIIRTHLTSLYIDSTQQNNQQVHWASELEKGKQFITQAETIMNDFKEGKLDETKLQGFLSNLNYSLIGGVVLGGISAMILNEILNNNKED